MTSRTRQAGLSLLEMTAVIALLGVIAAIIIPRLTGTQDAADIAACQVYRGDIEIQAELWNHNTGTWPAANLATIGGDTDYFPEGLPVCPVDGSAYTIDPATGLVAGHNH